MTCRECAEFLADYLANELEPTVRTVFEQHLTLCPNCVAYLEQYQATILAGQLACEEERSVYELAVPEELIRAILAARNR